MAGTTSTTFRQDTFARLARFVGRRVGTMEVEGLVVGVGTNVSDTGVPWISDALPILSDLVAATPLVVDPEAGVQERMEVWLDRYSRTAWIDISNVDGEREFVTSFRLTPAAARQYEDWCVSRERSQDLDTAWDRARRTRRTVTDQGGRVSLIDPGVVAVMDAMAALGDATTSSCEGHPHGAYLMFRGGSERVVATLKGEGWALSTATSGDRMARMPMVSTVDARDRAWRRLHAVLVVGSAPGAQSATVDLAVAPD